MTGVRPKSITIELVILFVAVLGIAELLGKLAPRRAGEREEKRQDGGRGEGGSHPAILAHRPGHRHWTLAR